MMTTKKTQLVTFTRWCLDRAGRTQVSINPAEVATVEDFCGSERPGSQIIMKGGKKGFLVWGEHNAIVAALNKKDEA
jgi:hypothetical protein